MGRHDRAHGVAHSTRQKGRPGKKKGSVSKAGGSTHVDQYASKPKLPPVKLVNSEQDAKEGN